MHTKIIMYKILRVIIVQLIITIAEYS